MLLGNNSNNNMSSSGSVMFRKQKTPLNRRKEKCTSARNSWSFNEFIPVVSSAGTDNPWTRQKSVSNLSNGVRDKSRDNRQGNVNKGVDYIRVMNFPLDKSPTSPEIPAIVEDRSLYGNPDGQSNHSTSERGESLEIERESVKNHQIPEDNVRNAKRNPSSQSPTNRADTSNCCRTSAACDKADWIYATPSFDLETRGMNPSASDEESSLVRKGLLWVMRDHLFSRWHERYCLLTRNYLNCFKRAPESSLTQMGAFLFKVKLAEVSSVEWLDKKGTAIVSLNLPKEGRVLIKTSHDLVGWFTGIQNCIRETRGRRQTLLNRQSGEILQNRWKNHLLHNRHSYLDEAIGSSEEGEAAEPRSLCFVAGESSRKTNNPSVQIPYRERSTSFDRSRPSKSQQRDAKRLSYFHSQMTQV